MADYPAPAPAPTGNEGVLANVPLFAGLSEPALRALEGFTFQRTYRPGEVIVAEGRTGNGLFVILSGRVEVYKGDPATHAQVLATFGPGESFGEMALFGEWRRTASVRAVEETTCVGIDRWVFLAYLRREPELSWRVIQFLAQRLAEANEKLLER
jgi:CRP-like cAMP-binding protein